MIKIVEAKDIEEIFAWYEKFNERTKKHTDRIRELEKRLKKLEEKE